MESTSTTLTSDSFVSEESDNDSRPNTPMRIWNGIVHDINEEPLQAELQLFAMCITCTRCALLTYNSVPLRLQTFISSIYSSTMVLTTCSTCMKLVENSSYCSEKAIKSVLASSFREIMLSPTFIHESSSFMACNTLSKRPISTHTENSQMRYLSVDVLENLRREASGCYEIKKAHATTLTPSFML